MIPNQASEIALSSGSTKITLSQSTGKVTRLLIDDQNTLVEPMPHEWSLGCAPNQSNEFNSSVAWGSDECFPNVAASRVWDLRDHGSIWGQQPDIVHSHNNSCTVIWKKKHLLFKRVISALSLPPSSAVLGAFELNMSYPTSIPLTAISASPEAEGSVAGLYAWHTLFEANPGDTVIWGTLEDLPDPIQLATGAWKINECARRIFAPEGNPIASKFYIQTNTSTAFATSILRKKIGVRVDVIQDISLPWLGIWWCHNAWGDGRPHSTIGVEPTNIPSDGPVLQFGPLAKNITEEAKITVVLSKLQES